METMLLRLVKPVLVAMVAFAAVFWLTGEPFAAAIVALLPLLLGWLGIMESLAYGLTAILLLAAVTWAIVPPSAKQAARTFYDDMVVQMKDQDMRAAAVHRTEPGAPPSR